MASHTHIPAACHKVAPLVGAQRHMVPEAADMLQAGLAEVEHRTGFAEVERHTDFEVCHTRSTGPDWGSESYYFSLLVYY